jgi:hypothetical protein
MSKFTYDKNGKFSLSRDNLRQLNPRVYEEAAEVIKNKGRNCYFTCNAIDEKVRELDSETIWCNDTYIDAWESAFGPIQGARYKHLGLEQGFHKGTSKPSLHFIAHDGSTCSFCEGFSGS